MPETTDHLPATKSQLLAIANRADRIEREVAGPFTRKQAREEIARLDLRIKELQDDGIDI